IQAPPPPAGSFDPAAAARGKAVFNGAGKCATCHTGTLLTDANVRLHAPAEVVTEPGYAARSATKMYRTSPLAGVWQHPPYFHDGSAPTLDAVVARYNTVTNLRVMACLRLMRSAARTMFSGCSGSSASSPAPTAQANSVSAAAPMRLPDRYPGRGYGVALSTLPFASRKLTSPSPSARMPASIFARSPTTTHTS